jgi:predicted RNA-binding protein
MCEANVYLLDDQGNEQLLLEAVDRIIPADGELILESIFNERKIVKAAIKEMALMDHKIILTRT